ncbi:hypothetical protein LZ32DRAFT_604827 [Colletotrichum eremochloae]|nr:hypothetical protein LZ32DRAFT_604827 [Colletotrichum eremochloae]
MKRGEGWCVCFLAACQVCTSNGVQLSGHMGKRAWKAWRKAPMARNEKDMVKLDSKEQPTRSGIAFLWKHRLIRPGK